MCRWNRPVLKAIQASEERIYPRPPSKKCLDWLKAEITINNSSFEVAGIRNLTNSDDDDVYDGICLWQLKCLSASEKQLLSRDLCERRPATSWGQWTIKMSLMMTTIMTMVMAMTMMMMMMVMLARGWKLLHFLSSGPRKSGRGKKLGEEGDKQLGNTGSYTNLHT